MQTYLELRVCVRQLIYRPALFVFRNKSPTCRRASRELLEHETRLCTVFIVSRSGVSPGAAFQPRCRSVLSLFAAVEHPATSCQGFQLHLRDQEKQVDQLSPSSERLKLSSGSRYRSNRSFTNESSGRHVARSHRRAGRRGVALTCVPALFWRCRDGYRVCI